MDDQAFVPFLLCQDFLTNQPLFDKRSLVALQLYNRSVVIVFFYIAVTVELLAHGPTDAFHVKICVQPLYRRNGFLAVALLDADINLGDGFVVCKRIYRVGGEKVGGKGHVDCGVLDVVGFLNFSDLKITSLYQ